MYDKALSTFAFGFNLRHYSTAHLREKTQQRRDLEANLRAETNGRVAAPLRNLRAGAYKDTHFNDLVVNNAGVGVGVTAVRVDRQAKQAGGVLRTTTPPTLCCNGPNLRCAPT
jgi:hypothetical protein